MKKNLIWILAAGAVAYWLYNRQRTLPQVIAVPVMPTDTMMPGAIGPAVEGVIKNGQELDILQ
jgi:hypothetical protein